MSNISERSTSFSRTHSRMLPVAEFANNGRNAMDHLHKPSKYLFNEMTPVCCGLPRFLLASLLPLGLPVAFLRLGAQLVLGRLAPM